MHDFRAREFANVKAVAFWPEVVHPVHRLHRLAAADVLLLAARVFCAVHSVGIADLIDKAERVGDLLVGAAREEVDVAVACGIDHTLGENGLTSLLAFKDGALHFIAVLNHVHAPGMKNISTPASAIIVSIKTFAASGSAVGCP